MILVTATRHLRESSARTGFLLGNEPATPPAPRQVMGGRVRAFDYLAGLGGGMSQGDRKALKRPGKGSQGSWSNYEELGRTQISVCTVH
jgi:hypothetical protein